MPGTSLRHACLNYCVFISRPQSSSSSSKVKQIHLSVQGASTLRFCCGHIIVPGSRFKLCFCFLFCALFLFHPFSYRFSYVYSFFTLRSKVLIPLSGTSPSIIVFLYLPLSSFSSPENLQGSRIPRENSVKSLREKQPMMEVLKCLQMAPRLQQTQNISVQTC
jgi:hypothetical protein